MDASETGPPIKERTPSEGPEPIQIFKENDSSESDKLEDETGGLSEHESHEYNDRLHEEGLELDDADVVLEREEGDGQESTPNRKVDDDEDKRNPQYIPKRGTFYEHDDRTAAGEGSEEEEPEEPEKLDKDAPKKKIWSEKESSKWSHDRFNDNEQAPKSKTELIQIYGYDIRNEDGPPRARRRRRYGRGPNKYTRNWEDEDAYGKLQLAPVRGGGVRKNKRRDKGEEFPPLRSQSKSSERPNTAMSSGSESSFATSKRSASADNSSTPTHEPPVPIDLPKSPPKSSNGGQRSPRPPPRRDSPQKPMMQRRSDEHGPPVNLRGVTRARGFRAGRVMESGRRPKPQAQDENRGDYIISQNFTNKNFEQSNVQELEKEMSNLNVQEGYRGGKFGGQRQPSVPPRMQGEQRGSKRYSSLRQRSLPETVNQPAGFGQHGNFYQSEFNQQPQAPQQPGLLPHPAPQHHPQAPSSGAQPIIAVPPPLPQVPAGGAPPLLQGPPPPQFAPAPAVAGYPQGPPPAAFLQAGVATVAGVPPPGAFLPQQGPPPQIINYAQAQFPQPGYTSFPHQPFNPVQAQPPQPAELFQSQGGITYYSTQNQQILPRIQAKRPKAAIPILPPPEHKEGRGRGRLAHTSDGPAGPELDIGHQTSSIDSNGVQYMTESPVSSQQ